VGRMPSGNQSSPGAGLSSPGPVSEAHERFFQAISEAEGTTKYGYNTVYGGANGIGGRPLTSMTLREITDHQKGMIAKTTHSPLGRFQMVRGSVLDHAKELGLDLDKTLFDQKTQNMLAMQEAKTKGVKPTIWAGFASHPKQLATAQQAYNSIKQLPVEAAAYTSTDQAQTPAQQAAASLAEGKAAAGRAPSESGSISRRGSDVAAMQRDLNSRGAKLKVDGLEGPLTRQAAQQFYGSPTSVRTPSFTASPPTPANNWSSLQGSPTRTVNQRQDYVPSPSFTNQQSYTSGRGDEGTLPRTGVASTPYLNNPYTPASAAPRTPYYNNPYTPQPSSYTSGRGDEGRGVPSPPSMNTRNMRVPTQSFVQTPYMNQPYTGPEWDVMPGAVQVPVVTPTARLPRARPAYGGPDYQPPEEAVPTLIDRLGNLVERAERALGGNRGSDSRSSAGSRSGGSGSYSGGNYGGQGGSRISEGVGGAYRNR
jgi:muramidase (phage lysozyme)/uncharacterized membrane protein YgcG